MRRLVQYFRLTAGLIALLIILFPSLVNSSQPSHGPLKVRLRQIDPAEAGKQIRYKLIYGPLNGNLTKNIEVEISKYGSIAISPDGNWIKEFHKGELDTVLFAVAFPDNDTTGFRIHFKVGDSTYVEKRFFVTTHKNVHLHSAEPENMPPHPYGGFDNPRDYYRHVAESLGFYDSLREQEERRLARLDSLRNTKTQSSRSQVDPLVSRARAKMRLEKTSLTGSLFQIYIVGEMRYIRFEGEKEFTLLGRFDKEMDTKKERRQPIFLKLQTNDEIRKAAEIIGDLPQNTVKGYYPDQILGSYRVRVTDEIVARLSEEGMSFITFEEYLRLRPDFKAPDDSMPGINSK